MLRDEALSASTYLRVTASQSVRPDVTVLGLAGELDAYSSTSLIDRVVAQVEPHHAGVVLDLAEVSLLSAAGAHGLAAVSAHLAETGRRMLLARCTPPVRDVIHQCGSALALDDYPSVAAALADYQPTSTMRTGAMRTNAAGPGSASADALPLEELRRQARHLPGPLQTRPLIAGALTELRNRYQLADRDVAFQLFRDRSQRHNIKLRTLALAFLIAPPTQPDQQTWFPGRIRHPAPPITFTERRWRGSRSDLLSAVIDAVLSTTSSTAGYLQLPDQFLGGLRLELSRGLPRQFTRSFVHTDGAHTPSGSALIDGRPVTADLDSLSGPAAATLDPSLHALCQQAEFRSIRSTPLLAGGQDPTAVVSTLHHIHRIVFTPAQSERLDLISRQAGTWLAWHQRTAVLDALEDLHNAARPTWAGSRR
jgi:anti-anti-sigma factor